MARLLIVIGLFGAVDIATPAMALEPICSSPAVIFCEDWETTMLPGRWADGYDSARHAITSTPADVFGGTKALQVTWPAGGDGKWLNTWLTATGAVPTAPWQAYDHVFVRAYWKLASNWQCSPINGSCGKMFNQYGLQTGTNGAFNPWSAFGQAGVCPNGSDYYAAGVIVQEPPTRDFTLYTSYPDMPCPGGSSYGQHFHASTPTPMPLAQWVCVEEEVLANTPGQHNGLQRIWVSGVLAREVLNMRWRDTTNLQTGAVQLTFSGANPLSTPLVEYVDNIVVSTQPIGCLSAAPAAPTNVQLR